MSNRPPSWATLVVATHRSSADVAAPEHVVGYALLEVTKLTRDDWSFSLDSSVANTLADEPSLIARLADRLPQPTFVIGRNIEIAIVAPLLRASERMTQPLRAFAGLRVALLQSACAVDLTVGTTRPRAPLPYAELVAMPAPITIAVAGDAIIDVELARADLEHRVVDEWLSFLGLTMNARPGSVARSAGSARTIGTASIATATWLVSRGLVR